MIALALLALVAVAAAQDTTAAAATTAAGAATTAASKCTADEAKKAADELAKCTTAFTPCATDADTAKRCACYKTFFSCSKNVKQCADVPTPGPTTADDKKKAIDACVALTGCSAGDCESFGSASSVVASVSVVLALAASRLF